MLDFQRNAFNSSKAEEKQDDVLDLHPGGAVFVHTLPFNVRSQSCIKFLEDGNGESGRATFWSASTIEMSPVIPQHSKFIAGKCGAQ